LHYADEAMPGVIVALLQPKSSWTCWIRAFNKNHYIAKGGSGKKFGGRPLFSRAFRIPKNILETT
jgi:hypothetical protein